MMLRCIPGTYVPRQEPPTAPFVDLGKILSCPLIEGLPNLSIQPR
jgi:hypothetical protein